MPWYIKNRFLWDLNAIGKDSKATRSKGFIKTIQRVSFFATLVFCITMGLAFPTMHNMQQLLEQSPQVTRLKITPPAGGSTVSYITDQEIDKIRQLEGVKNVYKYGFLTNIKLQPDSQSFYSFLSGHFVEKGDPQASHYGELHYGNFPEDIFPCGIILSEKGMENAKKLHALIKNGTCLRIYVHKMKQSKEQIKSNILYGFHKEGNTETYDIRIRHNLVLRISIPITEENKIEDKKIQLELLRFENSEIDDELFELELPIQAIARELPGNDTCLLPYELGFILSGAPNLPVIFHPDWKKNFLHPDRSPIAREKIQRVHFSIRSFDWSPEKKQKLQEWLKEFSSNYSLPSPETPGDNEIQWDVRKYRFYEESYLQFFHALEQGIKKIHADAFVTRIADSAIPGNIKSEPFPKVHQYPPTHLNVYVFSLKDIEPVTEAIKDMGLMVTYDLKDALEILMKIRPLFQAVVLAMVFLLSTFSLIAIGSATLNLIERSEGEIGIEMAFGNTAGNVLLHYILLGTFATLAGSVLGAIVATILGQFSSFIIQPLQQSWKLEFAFCIGPFVYFCAILIPILVSAVAVFWNTNSTLKQDPAVLIRKRVT